MYLKRIEIQGFKSFAQKTILEFPGPTKKIQNQIIGLTAIVGPNGSGKSNIVDAVRWVLGEQSLKLLRGKKSTDVIFSGSDKKARLGMAEVSLYLDNQDGQAPIEYSEIVISRKIYRDGSSEYLLNKNQVRLFDIIMLLAKANFGQNTYSVIGQGMVDKIVNYSNLERKEFFDEATGVKQFQIKRDRSVNKLKKTRDNLEQAQNLIKEIEPHLKSLTRQVNRLKQRQSLELELKETQKQYYGKIWLDLDTSYQYEAVKFSQADKKRMGQEAEMTELQQKIKQLSQEKSRYEEYNLLQSEYDKYLNQKNSINKQLSRIKGELEIEYIKLGKQDLSWLENRKEELAFQLKTNQEKLEQLKHQIGKQEKDLIKKQQDQKHKLEELAYLQQQLIDTQIGQKNILGLNEELTKKIQKLYQLQKSFLKKIKQAKNLEQIKDLTEEAENIFLTIDESYKKITQTEKIETYSEAENIKHQLTEYLQQKDLLVNEINETKINLEVNLSRQKNVEWDLQNTESEINKINSQIKQHQIKPTNKKESYNILQSEKIEYEKELSEIEEQIKQTKEKINNFNEKEEEKKLLIFETQQKIHQKQNQLNDTINILNEAKIKIAKIETKKEDLFNNIKQELGENYKPIIDKNTGGIDLLDAEEKIIKFKKRLELIGGTDPEVEKEYNEIRSRYEFLTQESQDLEKAITDLEKIVKELDKMIKKQFETEFKKINQDFNRYFKKLFEGGKAQLMLSQRELTEAEQAKEELAETEKNNEENHTDKPIPDRIENKSKLSNMGIDIEACPPGKKIKNINALSGGEKTMTALALICAIINNNPSPFILFDEVDAALDESNSNKFSDIIDELSHKTQFIIITHNRAVMARSNVLYGITMQGDGVSRLISLKLEQAKNMIEK